MNNGLSNCIVVAIVMATSLVTSAASAPRTESQICSSMKSAVERNGTLIRRHRGRDTRFVYHSGYCDYDERITWRIVRARDGRCSLKACEQVTSRSFR